MPTKLGELIKEAVHTEVKNAIITSPRFSDYRVQDFIDTGAFDSIDTELGELLSQKTKPSKKTEDELDKFKKEITETKNKITNIQSAITDPKGAISEQVQKQLENFPIAKLALQLLPIVSAALAAPAVINKIIDILIQPGGLFDKRLKIILEEQEEQFLDRLQQKRRQIGLDQVVITEFNGFGNANGRLTTNTLQQVKNAGVSDIGLNEISIGLK